MRFGDKVVGDAACSEEGPQWPENLGKKMGQNEHHNTELGQAIVRAHMASTIEKVDSQVTCGDRKIPWMKAQMCHAIIIIFTSSGVF